MHRVSVGQRSGEPRGSTLELVKEVDGAGGEHAEQRDTHCHCEIHDAS
ncbi:hypothetical protein [Paraburkholderia phenoliruptrix]|nr:hypothetical protein [Paraburkholderia phenoliruptrix]